MNQQMLFEKMFKTLGANLNFCAANTLQIKSKGHLYLGVSEAVMPGPLFFGGQDQI